MHRRSFLAFSLAACSKPGVSAPVLIAETEEFTEGPVFDATGNFFFTHGRFVSRITPAGEQSVWCRTVGANGHKILPNGDHLLCEPGAQRIIRLDASGAMLSVAAAHFQGKPLRAPNDVTLSPEGGWYFSDPGGSRDAPIGTVHYVDREGAVHLAADGLEVPNGLVLSADNAWLYVAETVPNRVLAYPVESPGKLGPMRVLADLPTKPEGSEASPDGMTIDNKGRIYVAHLGMSAVQVLSPEGELLRSLPGGAYDVSNLTFGPSGYEQLWITGAAGHRSQGRGRVYRLDLG